jgi:hypothetical protein
LTGLTGYHAGRVAEDIVARDYTDRAHVFAAKRWRSEVVLLFRTVLRLG